MILEFVGIFKIIGSIFSLNSTCVKKFNRNGDSPINKEKVLARVSLMNDRSFHPSITVLATIFGQDLSWS